MNNDTKALLEVYLKKKCNLCGSKLHLKKKIFDNLAGLILIYQCENKDCGHTVAIVDVTKKDFSAY